jgi:hypothetical protein
VDGKATVTPLPAASEPWQLAQVPSPGAPVRAAGGLLENAYKATGIARTAAVFPQITPLRPPAGRGQGANPNNIVVTLLVLKPIDSPGFPSDAFAKWLGWR